MVRRRSLPLVRLFGIRIGVHPSWLVVLFGLILLLSSRYSRVFPGDGATAFLVATATALLFFASVLVHELGHALVATRNGIEIAGIDLWLFGGLARMRREPPSAGIELRVALAGPLATVLVAAACAAAVLIVDGTGRLASVVEFERPGISPVAAVLAYLVVINVLLLLLNLLPALPLDGGRAVRALVWWGTGDRAKATRLAAGAGRLLGLACAGAGVALALTNLALFPYGVWLVVIGLFLTAAARSSELQTAVTSRIHGLRVRDVMDADPVSVPTQTRLDRVFEDFFLRYRFAWFPVVDAAGRFVGLVRRERVEEVPEERRGESTADEIMSADGASGVGVDDPLEALLASEELRRLGAIVALDREGVLQGVVTLNTLRRALAPAPQAGGQT